MPHRLGSSPVIKKTFKRLGLQGHRRIQQADIDSRHTLFDVAEADARAGCKVNVLTRITTFLKPRDHKIPYRA